jgi:hypothetical protein
LADTKPDENKTTYHVIIKENNDSRMYTKKLFVACIMIIFYNKASSQSSPKEPIKLFHLEFNTGLVIPSGLKQSGIEMGALLSVEPRYVLSSKLKLELV